MKCIVALLWLMYQAACSIVRISSDTFTLTTPISDFGEYHEVVNFGFKGTESFSTVPALALAIQSIGYDQSVKFFAQAFIYSLNRTGNHFPTSQAFAISVQGAKLTQLEISWVAWDPYFGFAIQHNTTGLSKWVWAKPKVITVRYKESVFYKQTTAVFLNGLSIQIGDIHSIKLRVVSSTQTSITIEISSENPDHVIDWVLMSIVVGQNTVFTSFVATKPTIIGLPIEFNITPIKFTTGVLIGFAGYTVPNKGVLNKIAINTTNSDNSTLSYIVSQAASLITTNFTVAMMYIASGCTQECASCIDAQEQNCTKCQLFRTLSAQNRCACSDGYFEFQPVNATCNKCDPNCQTCTGQPKNCLSCQESLNRTILNTKCVCKGRFFENNVTQCECNLYTSIIECHPSCLTCVQNPIQCLSCDPGLFRFLENTTCLCQLGYFQQNFLCEECSYRCSSCFVTEDNCISCNSTIKRTMISVTSNTSTCGCVTGFYEEGTKCEKCHPACKSCVDLPDKCLGCSADLNLIYTPATFNCSCKDKNYDYKSKAYCLNYDLEVLQRNLMTSSELDMVDNLRSLSHTLFNRSKGDGYFFYVLRRTTMFQVIATFDQPISQLNFLNITYPLLVFEFERFCSVFVFDYVADYLKANDDYSYLLFFEDVEGDVPRGLFNYQRVEVTPLFVLTGIDVLFSAGLYLIAYISILVYKKKHPKPSEEAELDPLTLYRITEDLHEQERQWVAQQAKQYLRSHSYSLSVLNFLFFWIMENKFALFMATMLLQLFEPSFDTPLEILSFVMCLVCLIIIASFHVGNIMILRRVRQQRQILKEYLNEIEMSTLAEPEPNQKGSLLPTSDYIELDNNKIMKQQYRNLLNDVTDALRQQEQRYIADLDLDKVGCTYHTLALIKKLAFAMICVFLEGRGIIQLWMLMAIHLFYMLLKAYMRPYTSVLRNVLSLVCDLIFILVLAMKINDHTNFQTFDSADDKAQRDGALARFKDQGDVTFGLELTYIIMSFVLQIWIIVTYFRRWCRCKEDEEEQHLPTRNLNLDVYAKDDFRRLLLELEGAEQVRALSNLARIFRQGDIILDQFLEVAFTFTYKQKLVEELTLHGSRYEIEGHYTIALKNANAKATLIIYQIRREISSKHLGIQQRYPLTDSMQLDLPVTLEPFQACYMHQYFTIVPHDVNKQLKLQISYQRSVKNNKYQNLIIMEATLAASINQILMNVDIGDEEAQQVYHNREQELVQKGNSVFVDKDQTVAYWSLVTQFLGFLIQGERPGRESMLAKFVLPEIESASSHLLDVYLIVEKDEPQQIRLQIWHRRFGQFTTYNNTHLYQGIIDNFFDGIINFFSA